MLKQMSNNLKFCVDCKHYLPCGNLCNRPFEKQFDLVTGLPLPHVALLCSELRSYELLCGNSGRFFEPNSQELIDKEKG